MMRKNHAANVFVQVNSARCIQTNSRLDVRQEAFLCFTSSLLWEGAGGRAWGAVKKKLISQPALADTQQYSTNTTMQSVLYALCLTVSTKQHLDV